jgi:hypothetical protein
MVFQTSKPSPAVRIRDNQRRSRARRKEYIEDLEQRIRRFERQGVEATTEVQAAARKVAKENALLRSLLVAHGVSHYAIDDYLRGKHYNTDLVPLIAKTPVSAVGAGTLSNVPTSLVNEAEVRAPYSPSSSGCWRACQQSIEHPIPSKVFHENKSQGLPHVAEITTTPPGPQMSTCCNPSTEVAVPMDPAIGRQAASTSIEQSGKTPQPSPFGPISQPCRHVGAEMPQGEFKMDDETSCEAAANIIASMRGGDAETVLAEIGCSPGNTCSVKNMTIFDLLDR